MNDVIRIVGAIGVFAGLIYWLFCRAKRRESARQVLDRCNAKRAHHPRRLDVRTWAQTHGRAAHFTPDGADAFAYMAAKSADDTPSWNGGGGEFSGSGSSGSWDCGSSGSSDSGSCGGSSYD